MASDRRPNTFQLTCEDLEHRTVLSTASLSGGVLYVHGTNGDDVVNVSRDAQGQFVVDGSTFAGQVKSIQVRVGNGNDQITIDSSVSVRTYLYGGLGNDTISGGSGQDIINAGDGTDHMSGNDGNDCLNGGTGGDYYDGGAGYDTGGYIGWYGGGTSMESVYHYY
jgi:Ca2+-binding RTX toxin-like protein